MTRIYDPDTPASRALQDRAAVVAHAVLEICATSADPLADVTAYLRDEIADIKQQTISDIRPNDE